MRFWTSRRGRGRGRVSEVGYVKRENDGVSSSPKVGMEDASSQVGPMGVFEYRTFACISTYTFVAFVNSQYI